MAFETLIARLNMLLNGMEHEVEDRYALLETLHLELNQLKATGQPLPEDLAKLEQQLEQELARDAGLDDARAEPVPQ